MQITENIYNVGTEHNNAYLVIGEKTALIDTVEKKDADVLISNIEEITPVNKIDYLVINHSELNKTGAVETILKKIPDIIIVATVATLRNIKEILNCSVNEQVAKDNGTLDLGNDIRLRFIVTPAINWPDSMMTYEENTKTLFSCDLFGNTDLTAFADYVQNALTRIGELKIDNICPGDGDKADKGMYDSLIKKKDKGILILYSSQYGCTEEMARTIADTIDNDAVLKDIHTDSISDINYYEAYIIGTPTLNRSADKDIIKAVSEIDAVKSRHKPFFTFGSYGWSGEGAQIVHNLLQSFGMRAFSKPFTSIFTLSDERRQELIEHTRKFVGFIYK